MNSEGLSADLPVDWTDEESEFFMRAVEAIALAYKEQTITLEEAGDRICMVAVTRLGEAMGMNDSIRCISRD
ncbi:hypothetical protein [Paraburkholderia sp. UCT2]|nr:hypothetical protein [Paraburkholderia sp. UCT2]MBC8730469.1 hypothetical protein [Paraburkholderia sp. UCT2]